MDINKIKSKINKRLVVTLLLSGICLLISYLETLIPSYGSKVPYARITISAAVIIFTLIIYGVGESILVMGISALVVGLITKSPYMILYYLIGGLFLLLTALGLLKTKKFGIIAISVMAMVALTLGETLISVGISGTSLVFAHFPMNAIFSCMSGLLCGIIVYLCYRYLPEKLFYSPNDK